MLLKGDKHMGCEKMSKNKKDSSKDGLFTLLGVIKASPIHEQSPEILSPEKGGHGYDRTRTRISRK